MVGQILYLPWGKKGLTNSWAVEELHICKAWTDECLYSAWIDDAVVTAKMPQRVFYPEKVPDKKRNQNTAESHIKEREIKPYVLKKSSSFRDQTSLREVLRIHTVWLGNNST